MKKILLSSAIAAALGTAGVANAAVDLDAATANPLVFAQELVVPAAGLPLNVLAAGQTPGGGLGTKSANQVNFNGVGAVEATFGFTIGQGTSKYVRITLDQPLAGALLPSDFGIAAATATGASVSVSQGGAAGDNYVVVEVAAATGAGNDILQTDSFVFAPAAGKIAARNKNTQNITYALYETAVDAVNQTNRLVQKSGEWIKFGPGYALGCTNLDAQIDVTERTQFIVSPLNTASVAQAATLSLVGGPATPMAFKADGTVAALTDYFGTTPSAKLTGSTAGLASAVLGTMPVATPVSNAFPVVTAVAAPTELNGNLVLTSAGGPAEMVASNYSVAITAAGDATTGYGVGTLTVDCGDVRYSGSEDRLDFALTPGGVFKQHARITNPSNDAGAVTVTVINDDGEEVTFNLGDIAGIDSTVLGAKASTKLIDINDIYAAAQAKDPSFAIAEGASNKLRVVVRGEFGDNAVDDNRANLVDRRKDGIYIQGLTVSRDNNAFFQTK